MKNDPIIDPPAIVRTAEPSFADRLTQLLADAQAFGRKSLEQKIACGRKLEEAYEEWKTRNAVAKIKTSWAKTLRRIGMSEWTARRLRTCAKSHDASKLHVGELKSQTPEFDAFYDDGIDPSLDPDKKPCPLCRKSGKAFGPKCPACRALNRKPAEPKADKPMLDMDGNPVPEHLLPVWLDAQAIKASGRLIKDFLQELRGLAERPGCAALEVGKIRNSFEWAWKYAWKFRAGLPCVPCAGVPGKQCKQCEGRGYLTVHQVSIERTAEREVKKHRKREEWQQKQRRSNEPLPE